ncbi:hypothetical protein HKX48_007769 [Thoreauomyces humboldtii]|nr:hypothetical protein HKX48_007769 [Thoreauomyces humboldtii]
MQEAAFQHYFPLLQLIFEAAFPGLKCPRVNLRPIQRVMLLALALQAWRRAMVKLPHLSIDNTWPVQSLFTFFDDYLPLMLDAPVIITSQDYNRFESLLVRSLPFFVQTGKHKNVLVILTILGRMGFYRRANIPLYNYIHDHFWFFSVALCHPAVDQHYHGEKLEAQALNLRTGKPRPENVGTTLFKFKVTQEINLDAAAEKLIGILLATQDLTGWQGRAARPCGTATTAGKHPRATKLHRFCDALQLGEAVLPLAQRPDKRIQVGSYVDISAYAYPCASRALLEGSTPCHPAPCGCCRHTFDGGIPDKRKCQNCNRILEMVMEMVLEKKNQVAKTWDSQTAAEEEDEEETPNFDN